MAGPRDWLGPHSEAGCRIRLPSGGGLIEKRRAFDRFCSKLPLLIDDIDSIKDISKLSQELNLVNENTPPSMAAGCIYLYIKNKNLNIHKKDISDVCKISEVTINKCYKKLEEYEELLIIPA